MNSSRLSRFAAVASTLAAISSGCVGAQPASQAHSPALWIVSIDGFRPEFYRDAAYSTPTFKELAKKGASAQAVEPIYPSITYPNHATLVTGTHSDRHGIYSNRIFDSEAGPTLDWYWNADRIRVKALWDAAREAGLSSALINWPVTVDAKADWVIPEVFPRDNFKMSAIWDETARHTRPETMREILKTSKPGFTDPAQHDEWMTEAARTVVTRHSPNLLLLHLTQVDLVQHFGGRASPSLAGSLKNVDTLVGKLLVNFDYGRDCLFITGDHGFSDVRRIARVNTLFSRKGWIRWEKRLVSQDLNQGSAQGGTHERILKWDVIAHPSGAQAAVYTRSPEFTREALALLKPLAKGRFRILARAELDSLHAFPGAAFAIEPINGFAISGDLEGAPFERLKQTHGEHGFLPTLPEMRTGFIATGACAPRAMDLGKIRILDLAPTAASVLGVSLPDAEGKALKLTSP